VAPFPAAIEDCKCAVRFLRAQATKYGIDPSHIGAWEASAGGHLVALIGTSDQNAGLEGKGGWVTYSSRVQAVANFYGPADFMAGKQKDSSYDQAPWTQPPISKFLGGSFSEKKDVYRLASPVTHVSEDDPPMLLIHGDKDGTVPLLQSQILEAALKSKGVPAELIVVKNVGHNFEPTNSGKPEKTDAELDQIAIDFFKRILK